MQYGLTAHDCRCPEGSHFAVQSSVLDEGALLESVARDYRIPSLASCRFLTRGDADVYRMVAGTRRLYLKVSRPPRTLDHTEAEASFVTALHAAGVPVVMPVPRMDGRFASRARAPEGERPMLLFEEAPPPLPSDPDESVLFPLGRTVARLHVAADELGSDFGMPAVRSEAFLGDCVEYSRPFLSEGDGAYLHEVATRLGRALESLPREAPGFGLCHADLVMSNLRRAADGTLVLFDFGAATRTWRAFELAVIHWSLGNRDADRRDALWPSVLRGYESVRPLPGGLVQHLPLMLVLRQIGFLGGNCATLPLRLGTEAIDAGFIERVMARLREFVDEAGIRGH